MMAASNPAPNTPPTTAAIVLSEINGTNGTTLQQVCTYNKKEVSYTFIKIIIFATLIQSYDINHLILDPV